MSGRKRKHLFFIFCGYVCTFLPAFLSIQSTLNFAVFSPDVGRLKTAALGKRPNGRSSVTSSYALIIGVKAGIASL